LKKIVLFALLTLTVAFSSCSGLLPSLKASVAAPFSNPLLQQQQQQQQPQQLLLPAIASPLKSPGLPPNVAPSVPHSLQTATTITSAVDGNNSPVQNDGTTTSNSVTFTFEFVGVRVGTTDNNPSVVAPGVTSGGTTATTGIAGFQCTLDNSPTASSCTSPITIHNLGAGNHIFQARAVDMAGNREFRGASLSWTVVPSSAGTGGLPIHPSINSPATLPRAVPPNVVPSVPAPLQRTTVITLAVDGRNSPVQNGGATTSNSITFIFTFGGTAGVATGSATTTTGIAGFQCTLDNSPTASSCTSPITIHNLGAGNHIFQARAVDMAGNREFRGASLSWTVLASSPSASSPPSAQPAGTTTRAPSSTTVPSSSGNSTSGGASTKANPSSSPATVTKGGTGGTNATTTAPTVNNNSTAAKTEATKTTATKSNLTSKTGSQVLGGWSGYAGLGGCIIGNPATGETVDSTNTGREQVFVVGCNHALFYNTQDTSNGAWSGFTSLGRYVISNPVLGIGFDSFNGFHLEAFVVGTDHAVYYNREDSLGFWSGFIRLPGYIMGDPAVGSTRTSTGISHTELVGVGSDHALYLDRQDNSGAWSGFTSLGGYVISNPALARIADGRQQIFVVGSDHALYTNAETALGSGTYSGFARLGGYVIGNPAAIINANGLLDVFVIGRDNATYVNREAGSSGVGTWNGFEKIGGGPSVISDPIIPMSRDQSDQINVFMIGSDHAVYHLSQVGANSDTWAFENLGGYVIGDPGTGFYISTTLNKDIFELFVVGSNHALFYNQNPTLCGCG
jgi:cell division septation protein DedD